MTETPTDGAISFEQAVESLIPQEQQPEPEAAPVEAAPEEDEETVSEADPNPAEDTSEAQDEPGDGEEAEEPAEAAAEPVDAPQWWDAEAKTEFSKLTPEAQAIVFAQEAKREQVTAKAKQEAAEARQKAEHEIAQVGRFAEALTAEIPKWQAAFRSKWGDNPDWVAHAQAVGVEQMTLDKLEWEQERAQLAEAKSAAEAAEAKAYQAFLEAEEAKLAETPLADKSARQEVAKYLIEGGIPAEQLKHVTAQELTIAHKAMLWDRAQAAMKAPKPKPAAPVRSAVKPTPAPAQSSKQRAASQIANRFAQTRSVEDAIALLLNPKG